MDPTTPPTTDAALPHRDARPGDTFPRQHARTRRFSLGEPRTLTVSPDGRRVVFLRSTDGSDPVTSLWVLDVASGEERLVADARTLLGGDDTDQSPEERAWRERAREQAGGITAYATDADVLVAAFALGGRLFGAGLRSGAAREIPVAGPVFDPRPDPTARRVAYVSGRQLRVADLDGTWRTLAGEDDVDVSWGSAEFLAAEEMGRTRGYWWSPDGERIVAARVDLSPVARWFIANPAHPSVEPSEHAYPRAGTDNALVTLHILGLDGSRVDVSWDRQRLPYVADVSWPEDGTILLTVQDRAQTQVQVLRVDPATGATRTVVSHHRADWVELVPGHPPGSTAGW
jgi:dipeptidyl-peptidase 4